MPVESDSPPAPCPSLREVLDGAFAFVAVMDRDGSLLDVNRPPLEAAAVAFDEVGLRPLWECGWWSHDAQVQSAIRLACRHAAEGRASRFDAEARMNAGRLISLDLTVRPLRDAEGLVTHIVASGVDVTGRKQREEALRASASLFTAISEQTSEVMLVKDCEGRILMANPAALALFGRCAGDVIGYTEADILADPAQAAALMAIDRRIMASGHGEVVEESISSNGEQKVWLSTKTPYRDPAGNVLGLIAVCRDITGRERRERDHAALIAKLSATAALAERKGAQLEAVLQAMAEGVAVFDMSGALVVANDAAARIHGAAHAGAMIGGFESFANAYELREIGGACVPVADWPAQRALRGESFAEWHLRSRRKDDGFEQVLSYSAEPVRDELGKRTLGVVVMRDITAAQRAEHALRASEEQARRRAAELQRALDELKRIDAERQLAVDVLEHGEAVCVLDSRFRIVLVNEKQEQLAGVPRSRMLGRVLWEVFPETANPRAKYRCEFQRVMRDRVPARFEEHYAPLDMWTLVNVYPMQHDAIAVFAVDINERKRAEQALRHADRQKDAFIAMLSHELRNPLSPIVVATHILHSCDLQDPVARGALDILTRQSRQMSRLLDDLLDVARITRNRLQLQIEIVDLVLCVQDAVHSSQKLIGDKGQRLELHLPGEPTLVRGDAVRLTQVVTNLLNNAAKYSPQGSRIDVAVEPAADEIVLTVKDEGPGIHPDLLPHVFNAFYDTATSAHPRQGLGIGLWLTHRLVGMHGGTITAGNIPGAGAGFTVRLPRR